MDTKDMIEKDTSPRFDLLFIGAALVDCIIKGFDPEPISATGYRAAEAQMSDQAKWYDLVDRIEIKNR